MASNGASAAFAPADVLNAMETMRGSEEQLKKEAMEYLERFQKSVREPILLAHDDDKAAGIRCVLHGEC